MATIDLTAGDDRYTLTDGTGASTIRALGGNDSVTGGPGNDRIEGGDGDDVLDGASGDDLLQGGAGSNVLIGGAGIDQAAVIGNAYDLYLARSGGDLLLIDRVTNSQQTITPSIETVAFANGQYLARGDVSAYVAASRYAYLGTERDDVLVAPQLPVRGRFLPTPVTFDFDFGTGFDTLVLPGNVQDYALSRVPDSFVSADRSLDGDFILRSTDQAREPGSYAIAPSIETVRFANGQYLSLKDVPAYVSGTAALSIGAEQDDLLFQTLPRGYSLLAGGAGNDTAYLRGNIADYTVRAFEAYAATRSAAMPGTDGQYRGVELVGRNGSGSLFVADSTETVQFLDGTGLAYGALATQLAADPMARTETIGLGRDERPGGFFLGTEGLDRVLLNGTVADYTLDRNEFGDFTLSPPTFLDPARVGASVISQEVETVQFVDGQYLALADLRFYISGDASFTAGTDFDDLLIAGVSGDQVLTGGRGFDEAYIGGNVHDYTLERIDREASRTQDAFHGYALHARNASGDLFIDDSVESVHFQNGQYLSPQHFSAYIDPFAT